MTLMADPDPSEPLRRATPLHFLLGYLAGVGGYLLVRALGGLNPEPCQGQTVVALIIPLLLGPGGLGLAASQWNHPPRALFGLGLVVASLFPALFFGVQDIAGLRNLGCAGGYVVIRAPGGRGLSELTLVAGSSLALRLRIGGFDVKTHADDFTLRAQASNPLRANPAPVQVRLGQETGARLAQEIPLTLTAAADGPTQQYTVNVQVQQQGGRSASGSLTVNVQDRGR